MTMPRGKKETDAVEFADAGTHEVEPLESAQRLESAEVVPVERAAAAATNGEAAPARRKARRNSTERTYWVCGRKHAADAWRFIMPKPTVGQARKAKDTVRAMPDYAGMELAVCRVVRVE
jgi:hypothetical protein